MGRFTRTSRRLVLAQLLSALPAICLTAAEPAAAKLATPFHAGYRTGNFTYDAEDGAARTRKTYCWYPTAVEATKHDYRPQVGLAAHEAVVAPGEHPAIVFSHGFLGGGDQTIFLMEELARRGYIVIACNHADSLGEKRVRPMGWPNFADPKSWDDTKYRDRRDDLVALLDHLLRENDRAGSPFEKHVNAKAIGAAGHSLGGYTVAGLVGGWETWRDKRFSAALLLSPYITPFLEEKRASQVTIPVMLQGGTLDFGITPFLPQAYQLASAPKYYLVLRGETHFGWTNLISLGKTTTEAIESGNAELITKYSVAFFDRHLKRDPAELLDANSRRLASYEHAVK